MSYLSPIDAAQVGFDPYAVDGDDGLDPVADSDGDGDAPTPGATYAAPAADRFEDARADRRQGPDQTGDVDGRFGREKYGDRFDGDDLRGRFGDRDDRRVQGGRVFHEGMEGMRDRDDRFGRDVPYANGDGRQR